MNASEAKNSAHLSAHCPLSCTHGPMYAPMAQPIPAPKCTCLNAHKMHDTNTRSVASEDYSSSIVSILFRQILYRLQYLDFWFDLEYYRLPTGLE